MTQKNYNYGNNRALRTVITLIAFIFAAPNAQAQSRSVTLTFLDSVMVRDTIIRVRDIARVTSDDAALAARVGQFVAGEAAPAGFSRFINSDDFVIFRLQPTFKDVRITGANSKRVKVLSDHQERTVAEFEAQIREYAASRLNWNEGEWELTINNLRHVWKSARGPLEVTFGGLDNPFAKGNVTLTLTARQGSRVWRVPVQCRIAVNAAVLVASQRIEPNSELNASNTTTQVVDITNFAFVPVRELPPQGTMMTSRTVTQGNIVHDRMLRAIPLVSRGDRVRIHFVGERVKVSVVGIARDNGGNGDRIWVENLQTGKLLRAAVSGRGSVVVHNEGDRS